jgi:hypothetical protein
LMASTIMRSELMRGTQGFWCSSYVRIAEPSARSSAILYARRSRTGRWPRPSSMARLAARHTILDVVPQIIGPIHVAPSFHTRRRGRPFYDRLSPLIAIRKTAPTRLFACGGPTRKHTTLLQIG